MNLQNLGLEIATAMGAFTATNLDDLVVLLLLFGSARTGLQRRRIVAGQYLGFTLLLLASLPGFFGGILVPRVWLGWLGLLPLGIGLWQWLHPENPAAEAEAVELAANPFETATAKAATATTSPAATSPAATSPSQSVGAQACLDPNSTRDESKHFSSPINFPTPFGRFQALFRHLLHPTIYQVAAITVANGGDNLGIYLPLFASRSPLGLGVMVIVFYLLVNLWCIAALWLTKHRAIAHIIQRYGHKLVPWVLMALGVAILLESGLISHLSRNISRYFFH